MLTAKTSVETVDDVFSPRTGRDGKPEAVVPFNVSGINDVFLVGVEPTISQVYAIQGAGGTRKTTFLLNEISWQCLSGTLPENHQIIVDDLESGMSIERYLVTIRTILATKILIYEHWLGIKWDGFSDPREYVWHLLNDKLPQKSAQELVDGPTDVINGKRMNLCVFTVDFIKACYREIAFMTERQMDAWDLAGKVVKDFPITVFGISEHPDRKEAERRSDITTILDDAEKRWAEFDKEYDSVQIVVDYMQEYYVNGIYNLYDKQLVIVPRLEQFVKEHFCTMWIVSQESINQQFQFQNTGTVYGSAGGNILKNASHTNWRVGYEDQIDPYHMTLFRPVKSRRGVHPDLRLNIEPNSGAIFGKSIPVVRG